MKRIGVIGPLGPDLLADNILHTLPELGFTPVPLGPIGPSFTSTTLQRASQVFRGVGAEAEQFAQRALLRRAKDSGCDVIINVQAAAMPSTIAALQKAGSKVCLWYPDAISNIGRLSMVHSEYDALFLKDPLFADRLARVYGLPAHYVPEACNPTWHRPIGIAGSDQHIAVVGNIYPTRARLLRSLHDSGVPLRLYGSGFPRWFDPGPLKAAHAGHPVFREAKSAVFRQARGVLNNLHPAEMQSVNCRLFEAAAAGGAVLCEQREGLEDLFTQDEVLTFCSYEELLDRCEMLLADGTVGRRYGDAASKRAHGDHNYAVRLRRILEIMDSPG